MSFHWKTDALQHVQQRDTSQQRGHHILQDDIGPITQVERRHHDAVEHWKRVYDDKVVGASGQCDDARDDRVVDFHRLNRITRSGKQVNSVRCLGRDLTDHRGVQSIPLSDRVAEGRFRLNIQQRRGDPHLQ